MTGDRSERRPHRFHDDGVSGLAWGDGPARAVLLHGALLSASAWDRVLSGAAFPALALDLPGHGESAWWDDGGYTSDRVSSAIAEWWSSTARIAPRSVLIGHSRGALVAVHVAARIPARLAHLVLVDADPTRPRPSRPRRTRMRSTGSFEELVEDASGMRPDLSPARVADGVRRGAIDNGDGTWSWRWDPKVAEVPIGGGLLDGDIAALESVTCPVTVVRGRESPAVSRESLARIESTIGRTATVHTLPGGHNPHSEAPDALRTILDDLVRTEIG